jgi:protein gp37
MGQTTAITWTDATWNPWRCKNCYMFRDQIRYGNDPHEIIRAAPGTFNAPLKWQPSKIFTCSWSDFFIEQADPWRDDAWEIIRKTPQHTYQILTKRPENIWQRLPKDWGNGYQNVWMGVTIESNKTKWRAYGFGNIPAKLRFISYEPSLEAVDFEQILENERYSWIISGGESGPGARPAQQEWFMGVRNQCAKFGVSYFHKQNGGTTKIDGVWGGDKLNDVQYHEYPQVRI